MDLFQHELKIPKERVAVLIGVNGKIKKEIEDKTNTKIEVDSEAGDVFISGHDGLNIYNAKEVVTAIGRGFNPQVAKLILKGDHVFEVVNIRDFGKTKKEKLKLKGRVIGEDGKSRKTIEDLTEVHISIYGKTVSIIGEPENCANAKHAIISILRGAPHSSVYRWLEKKRKLKKHEQMLI
jgi:ribosomal RNA assembly protein